MGEVTIKYLQNGVTKSDKYTISQAEAEYTVVVNHDKGTAIYVIGDLQTLEAPECGITSININKCKTIVEVFVKDNLLTRFDASKNPTNNTVDVSDNPNCTELLVGDKSQAPFFQCYINGTAIKKLDVSGAGYCDIVHGGSYDEIISSHLLTLRHYDGTESFIQNIDAHMIAYPILYEEEPSCGIISTSGNITILDKEKFISDLPKAPVGEMDIKFVFFPDMSPEQNARIQAKGWITEMP